jgi:serine/threonine protein kinase/WD40 repeat protein
LALDSAELPEHEGAPARGARLGDYELIEEIGRGAMGVVYRARQVSLKRIVALKVVQSGQFASEAERKRFLTEAELAATLDHPNLVPVYEVGTADGRPFCAMKLVEGRSLAAMVAEGFCSRRQCAAHCPPPMLLPGARGCCVTAAALIEKVARAVHHAHQRGVIHRDLKPGNILVDAAGEPHVMDFGLARRLDDASTLTLTGSPLGTPAYMSPEQARGEKVPTTASDIWSLGAILYELLAGRPPFVAENVPALLRKIADEEPVRFANYELRFTSRPAGGRVKRKSKIENPIDPDLATICLKCLEKDPARRYDSAAVLADDLDRWQRNEPILARSVTAWQRALKWIARHPRRTAMLLALLAVFLAGVAGVFWQGRRAELRAQDSRDRLLRLHVLNAGQRLATGDPLSALPWLAAALADELSGSPRREVYHTALANVLRRSPLPEHVWWQPGRNHTLACSTDGRRLLVVDPQQDNCWLLDTTGGAALKVQVPRGGSAAFSPDGACFAVGGQGFVTLCATESAAPLGPSLAHTGWVTQLAFSPDGRWLVTRALRSGVRLWDATHGTAAGSEFAHPEHAWAAFSPDSRRLATTGQDGWLRLWEVPSGRLLATNKLDSPWQCVFSPDGRWLLVGRRSNRDALLLDATTLEPAGSRLTHQDYVEQVAFSPDSQRVATGSADGRGRVWSVPGGQPVTPVLELDGECTALAFGPDGQAFATGSKSGLLRVWSAETGRPLSPWLRHAAAVRGLAFLPDGRRLCSTSADASTRVWSLAPPVPESMSLRDRSEPVWMAHFSADTRRIIVRGPQSARVYDGATGASLTPALAHGNKVDWASESADQTLLLTQSRDQQAWVWKLPAGELLRTWTVGDHIVDVGWLAGHDRFATLAWNGAVTVWPLSSNAPLWQWREEGMEGRRLGVSPDGRWLAVAFSHSRLGLWSAETARPVALLRCPEELRVLRFHPDSTCLATGDDQGRVQFRRTRDGVPMGNIVRHGERILDLAVSPDGETLASLSADGLLRLSTVPGGLPAGVTLRPAPGARKVSWCADGRRLLVQGESQVQVWDAGKGVPLTPVLTQPREVAGAALSRTCHRLWIVTEDARLRIEPLDAPSWPAADWQFLARVLSSQEVDASANAVPWFGLGDDATPAEADALNARWQQLRLRLPEMK